MPNNLKIDIQLFSKYDSPLMLIGDLTRLKSKRISNINVYERKRIYNVFESSTGEMSTNLIRGLLFSHKYFRYRSAQAVVSISFHQRSI